jgi:prefoldin alpha subunit
MEDNEFRQALAVLDAYQRQLETLSGQADLLRMSLDDALRARDTLQAVAGSKEGDDILIPIGSGIFVHATVSKKRSAVVGVGSRVSVEKDLPDAVTFTVNSVNEVTEALKRADSAIREVDEAARKLSAAVQQEYQRRQQ